MRILDRGRQKWIDEARELTTDEHEGRQGSYRADATRASALGETPCWASIGNGEHALVDVCSPQEFSRELIAPPGYEQEGALARGSFPTAQSIPWAQALRDDGTFKADELRSICYGKGVTEEKQVTAYCRIGERSAHTWFVLCELLGYRNVQSYDGSWTEWGNLVDVPIEKGVAGGGLSGGTGARCAAPVRLVPLS